MQLVSEKPETEAVVKEKLTVLQTLWQELESTTQTKAQCLFDANKAELFTQSCADLDKWLGGLEGQIQSDDYGKDLTSVNILLKKQQVQATGRLPLFHQGSSRALSKAKDLALGQENPIQHFACLEPRSAYVKGWGQDFHDHQVQLKLCDCHFF